MAGNNQNNSKKNSVGIGLVGLGYWGPKVLRNLMQIPQARVVAVCDSDQKRLDKIPDLGMVKTTDFNQLLENKNIQAIVVTVPIEAHYGLAKKALQAKKHIWVEKPLTNKTETALELYTLSKKVNRVLFVDHTFVYNPAVKKMKEIIDQGLLGEIYYFDSTRVNLGLFQSNVNVVWDLAPHDISILNYLITQPPATVSAIGAAHVTNQEELAYVHLSYSNNMIAHFNFNWLSPVKIRKIIVGGSNRLLIYDDTDAAEKIKLYDKGVHIGGKQIDEKGKNKLLLNYRMGDITVPYIDNTEALSLASKDFVQAIIGKTNPTSGGSEGVKVVQIVEAIDESLKNRGETITLSPIKE